MWQWCSRAATVDVCDQQARGSAYSVVWPCCDRLSFPSIVGGSRRRMRRGSPPFLGLTSPAPEGSGQHVGKN
jgi:hypothetical protein